MKAHIQTFVYHFAHLCSFSHGMHVCIVCALHTLHVSCNHAIMQHYTLHTGVFLVIIVAAWQAKKMPLGH